ncbi:low affinity copper transporter [Stagonosporopsis vannaccii]|nr:low affinity copper transporter [Stagonosporopsis vannaccii]
MDMSMTTAMSATTTEAMAIPTSTSSSSMTMMGADSMAMTFFVSTSTPLWSTSFSPHNAGQYAGICTFLIAFAVMFRLLLAVRVNFLTILDAAKRTRYSGLIQSHVTEDHKTRTRPWRADEAVMMAGLDVVVAGVSYLLMLAVMTFNVGYLLSVLGGVFLGSLVCGRFTGSAGSH